MVKDLKELASMIANRDGISFDEAADIVEKCQIEIDYIAAKHGSEKEAEDAIYYWLGLEPDYLDLFL